MVALVELKVRLRQCDGRSDVRDGDEKGDCIKAGTETRIEQKVVLTMCQLVCKQVSFMM